MLNILAVGQSEYYIYNVTQGDTSINLLDTQAASESYYFLTKSEFLSPGYLKGFWYYATAPGNISITVSVPIQIYSLKGSKD